MTLSYPFPTPSYGIGESILNWLLPLNKANAEGRPRELLLKMQGLCTKQTDISFSNWLSAEPQVLLNGPGDPEQAKRTLVRDEKVLWANRKEARTTSLRSHLPKRWKTGLSPGHRPRVEAMKLGVAGRG